MSHSHSESASHDHRPAADADRRWLTIALALIGAFMVAEVAAGLLAGSLALLSDAAHMLGDAGAIALALGAAKLAGRPAGGRYTFGLGRAEVLSAQLNGATLLVLAGVLGWQAIGRLADGDVEIAGAAVLAVGALGAGVNIGAAAALARAERRSLALEGARAHVMTDLYGSLAAVVAGGVILATGWTPVDALAALVVVVLMLRSGWGLLRDSGRVLLEGAPAGLDPQEIGREMAGAQGVVEVHDLHVWELTAGFPALAAHVLVEPGEDCHAVRRALQALLAARFSLRHVTLQVDHANRADELLQLEPEGSLRPE